MDFTTHGCPRTEAAGDKHLLNRPVCSQWLVVDTRPTSLYSQGVRHSPRHGPPDVTPPASVGERILSTASELFYREGVRAVGIQRVIDEAGIAKASLYAHYASKDDLVAACIEQRAAAWRTRVDERLGGPGDARSKLLKLFDLGVEWISAPGFRGCPFLNAGSEIADPSHPARIVTARHREWLRGLITSLVREAGVHAIDEVAGALIVLHDGAAASALVDGNPSAARHARRAAERLLDAYLQPSAAAAARLAPRRHRR